ncbi:hypothetical protein Noc_1823 [Nitrosococcus oceani ATCC 19707]|uniref:Uncharacterized protein n=2 Tax=Nitrosococcus oceani TaxID=1229 RepID=Q3JA55_NITOC|nr:hypothetical protein [Nitrosococcus oceani]ABA58291.1 hypothetical protein Noc_1823 [Nitrosococcus oceani ATCC 19707]KFI19220.1 hypothetical protein IB75_09690 [Nitrosococcus oceani C-27]GEM18675.1 hypothetical protein NONS58_00310 [Nitrosococcus oceani]
MKTFHLLIVISGLAVLSIGVYITLFSTPDDVTSHSSNMILTEEGVRNDEGDESVPSLVALEQEMALLKMELAALKQTSTSSNRLQQEIVKLKKEVMVLRGRVESLPGKGEYGSNVENEGDSPASAQLTEQDMIAAAEEEDYKYRKRMEIMERVFLSENIDPQWSTKTSGLITQHLEKGEQTKTNLEDVDCRATLCRVAVNHQDAAVAEEFQLQFPMQMAEALPQINYLYEQQADGSVSMVMYLARDGYDLPQVTQLDQQRVQ